MADRLIKYSPIGSSRFTEIEPDALARIRATVALKHPVYVVDTREQLGYSFDEKDRRPSATVITKLDQGDYSVLGFEDKIAIERKMLGDYIGSITDHFKTTTSDGVPGRFWREIERLEPYRFSCIIVEGDMRDVLSHAYRADVHPSAILGMTVKITLFGVPVLFASDRIGGRKLTQRLLRKFWEYEVKHED